MAEQVKDLALSLQQLRWLLWREFKPCPGNVQVLKIGPKKKKKKKNFQLLINGIFYVD